MTIKIDKDYLQKALELEQLKKRICREYCQYEGLRVALKYNFEELAKSYRIYGIFI